MDFAFPWPMSDGEWLAWWSAAVTIVFGVLFLFAPRLAMRALRLQAAGDRPEAIAEVRGRLAGFHLGVGLSCMLLAQPFLYIALGAAWIFSAFGRIISILSDRGLTLANCFWLVVELVLAALPLAFVLGFVP